MIEWDTLGKVKTSFATDKASISSSVFFKKKKKKWCGQLIATLVYYKMVANDSCLDL